MNDVRNRAPDLPATGKRRASVSFLWARSAFTVFALVALLPLVGCKKGDPIEMLSPPATPQALQKYWSLPDFSLTDQSGQAVGLADLKGKVWVADFIYTTCPGPCPILTSRLGELQKAVGGEAGVRFVSLSTDPDNDTPEVLKAYAERFKAGPHWLFLTGKKEAIYSLALAGFKLPIAPATAGGEAIVHSTRLVLVDKTGVVRGFYDGVGDIPSQGLVGDIHRLLEEK
jgi:protein SCO1